MALDKALLATATIAGRPYLHCIRVLATRTHSAAWHSTKPRVGFLTGVTRALHTTPDPISASRTREQFGIRSPYLLSVGGFEPHKNTSGVLEALILARRQRPDLKLVVVGTGRAPDSLLAEITRLGLVVGQDVIVFSDLRNQLIDIYDGAAVFVSMSWRESFGVPALEAMARGIPVVASRWGAGPEVIGDAGLLIDPRNPKEAADAILQALKPGTRAMLTARGREQVQRFTWEQTARGTAAVYRQLVGSGWGARG